ncbi:MAG: tripartite tricarboxylate transporter TctB family protein [Pseudomonadota bacterium]
MKITDILGGIIGLLFSLFIFWRSFYCPKFAVTIAGPRFFPQILSLFLGGLSVFLLIQSIFIKKGNPSPAEGPGRGQNSKVVTFSKVMSAILASIVYVFAMREVGFLISTFIFFVFLMLLMQEKKKLFQTICWAIAVTGVNYFLFAILLRASLPIGVIFR